MSTSPRAPGHMSTVALFALAASVTALALSMLTDSPTRDRGDPGRPGGGVLVDSPLFTANRDRVAACVQVVGAELSDSAMRPRIEGTLWRVMKNPSWERSGLPGARPRVDVGCPRPPAAFAPGAWWIRTGGSLVVETPVFVTQASYYRLFVFIVPPDKRDDVFQMERPVVSEEYLKLSLHEGVPVTTGLCLTAEERGDMEFLAECLTDALGLRESEAPERVC